MKSIFFISLALLIWSCKKETASTTSSSICKTCGSSLWWTPIPYNSQGYFTYDTVQICQPALDTIKNDFYDNGTKSYCDTSLYQAIGKDGKLWNVWKKTRCN